MVKAFIIKEHGGVDKLKLVNIPESKPTASQVLIKHTAIGLSFNDVSYRNGTYPIKKLPAVLGREACGIIEAIGEGVSGFNVGDRVAYATGPMGAYSEKRVISAKYIVKVPREVSDKQAAACLRKAMTAHYLLFRTCLAQRAGAILVHSAAGGVGQYLAQYAKHMGLVVVGTVGSPEKVQIAKENGCEYVIDRSTENFADKVLELTGRVGIPLIYDGIGKDVFRDSIRAAGPMAYYINYGDSSGLVGDFNLGMIRKKCLVVTKPTIEVYKMDRKELLLSAAEVFSLVTKGILKPNITEYGFEAIPQAHKDFESRKTTGHLVAVL